MAEAELDEEIRGLLAGDERRGSSASEAHGCRFDAGLLQQFVTMGAEQAMQHLSVFHGEPSKVFEVQHQPTPVPVRVPRGKEEEEGRKMRNEMDHQCQDHQCQGAAMKGFWLVLFLILLHFQRIQVNAMETSLVHPEMEMEVEADRFARRNMETNAETRREDPVHFVNSNSSSRFKEMGCCEEELKMGKEKPK